MEAVSGQKRGFLHEDYRIFHLKDDKAPKVEYHYHEFDKLVLLLSGRVTYHMEGIPCVLEPGDLLFVPHGSIHMPVIAGGEEYERYVIWMTPDFLERIGSGQLSVCFDRAGPVEGFLRHTDLSDRLSLLKTLDEIHEAGLSDKYMASMMAEKLFACFMIKVCRIFLEGHDRLQRHAPDPKMTDIMKYIDDNLAGDLSVDALSSAFYISRYHLMRRFKEQSGYTLHQYITRRRVLAAAAMIGDGLPVTKAAPAVGYDDYSAFLRAFRSVFKVSPKSFGSMGSKKDIDNE